MQKIRVGQQHGVNLGDVGLHILESLDVEFVVPAAIEQNSVLVDFEQRTEGTLRL
jgi:hypothetical protein